MIFKVIIDIVVLISTIFVAIFCLLFLFFVCIFVCFFVVSNLTSYLHMVSEKLNYNSYLYSSIKYGGVFPPLISSKNFILYL